MGLVEFIGNRPEPPTEWFSAFGDKDTGILRVGVNEKFFFDNSEQAGHYYVEWCEQVDIFNSPGSRPQTIKRAGRAMSKAAAIFLKETGFSPRDISGMAHQLSQQYKGKKEAPIDTRLL